jgi:hypothetical protein
MPDELYLYREEPLRKGYDPAVVQAAITPAGFTLADVRRLYMRLWLRHAHEGHPAPNAPWSAEDDAALRACASVVKEKNDDK